uniref:Uncharacterized protein n=1 Tax=Cacopsylla melanoneura TaxID=428564 RepID=A0A8D8TFK8_9HEMI
MAQYRDPYPPPSSSSCDSYDDRYKMTDPLLQRDDYCVPRPRDCPPDQQPVFDPCDHIGQRTMLDFYCTEHNLFDAAASNYFKYKEPLGKSLVWSVLDSRNLQLLALEIVNFWFWK